MVDNNDFSRFFSNANRGEGKRLLDLLKSKDEATHVESYESVKEAKSAKTSAQGYANRSGEGDRYSVARDGKDVLIADVTHDACPQAIKDAKEAMNKRMKAVRGEGDGEAA